MNNPMGFARNPIDCPVAKKSRKKSGNVEVNTLVVQLKAPTVVKEIEKVPDDRGSVISSVVSDLANEIASSVDVGIVNEKEKETDTQKKLSIVVHDKVSVAFKDKESEKETETDKLSVVFKDKESEKDVAVVVGMSAKPVDVDLASKKDDVVVGNSSGLVYEKRNSNRRKATGSVDKATGSADVDNAMVLVEKAKGSADVEKATGSVDVEKGTGSVENVTTGVSKPKKANVVLTDVVDKSLRLNVKGPSKASVEAVLEKDEPSKKLSKSTVVSKRKRGDSDIIPDDMGKKKLKGKGPMKIQKDDSPEGDIPDGVMKQLLKNMLKNASVKEFVKEEYEENQLMSKNKETRPVGDDFEAVWKCQFHKLFKDVRVNDIALKLIASKEVDFLFKINFLTLLTNTMVSYTFLVLYSLFSALVFRFNQLQEASVVRTRPVIKQWSSFLMAQRQEMELKEECIGESDLYEEFELPETEGFVAAGSSDSSFKEELLKNLEEKLSILSIERIVVEELLVIAGVEFPGDLKLVELHQRYVQILKHPVSSNGEDLDRADDNGGDKGDDDTVNDKHLSVVDPSQIQEGSDDGNGDDKDVEKRDDAVPEKQIAEPFSLTQWIENHLDLIEEWFNCVPAEFYYQKCVAEGTMEPMGVGIPATRASDVSPSPIKRLVKPPSYLLSPYMNKKTRVELKMTRPEFILGNSIFAMRGEKLERVFETHSGELYSVRLIMETLAPGLEVDANVIDCLAAILNHENSSREAGCPLRHFFPTGCITITMFDGTLESEDAKFEEFEKELSAQFKDDVGGLALNGVELPFFPIRKVSHFYVVVFSLTKKITTMTILDNSDCGATYAEKYEDTCELLKTLFARHLEMYGHKKHASIRKVKPRIASLKWKTKNNDECVNTHHFCLI
ncbi:ulp1 protease family, C-terminal catalytic domain-containing protein [Artemisia annua]|uniref:Ulp1 protease family, C-terminal catalytic domain-containing protein n=1 Tax=Artemisia annua TaxID=35608 RepID=A0A2U1PJY4_ARTAN|nr:ulp1 protease family, C-terminal catalytic domain-containing protein [Artemisia annua]